MFDDDHNREYSLEEGARIVLSEHRQTPPTCLDRRRRKRTVIETDLRRVLEAAFRQEPRPSSGELRRLGSSLGLDTAVVRVWFCNRYDWDGEEVFTVMPLMIGGRRRSRRLLGNLRTE